jgi:hypothetical protein
MLHARSHYDAASGSFMQKRPYDLHQGDKNRWVNAFSRHILSRVRANMDIKYIGSSADCHALMMYIASYITKGELSTAKALPLIGAALFELDCFQDIGEDEGGPAERSRRFLIKAANKLRFYTERSSPWCLTYLLNYTISYTNRMFAPLVSGNMVRAVQTAFGEKLLQSQNAASKASARVEVLDADGTLFMRDSLSEYIHRPTHSKTRYLPFYLMTASWRFQRMTTKLKHRMLPQPGYNGPPLESDHDDSPISVEELLSLPAPSATVNTHGYLHCPGTVPYMLGPKVPIAPDADATQAQNDY